MAGAGILKAEYNDSEFQAILNALSKAAMPDLRKIAAFAGAELKDISHGAFKKEADPVTGIKWKDIKPRDKEAKSPGSTGTILQDYGQLKRSLTWEAYPDGSVIFGSNMVYARIHQQGGKTRAHEIVPYHAKALYFNGRFARKVKHPGSLIPARPYMGVPQDFDRRILNDPEILKLLGLEA
ncbi:MAG: phage virion morphogenesis protein [Treponema sp.]|jgi:phage virion morphogenesis protein|nr:phage virion morphogenesis protein [Treponema sp.]